LRGAIFGITHIESAEGPSGGTDVDDVAKDKWQISIDISVVALIETILHNS